MVPADSARISRVPAYSGAVLSAMLSFAYGAVTLCGAPFQKLPLNIMADAPTVLQPRPCRNRAGLGCCAFARHYLRNRFCFLFLRVMRCFSSPGWPLRQSAGDTVARAGLPHSEIRGSGDICSSPRLIAACHVLLRLRQPRHPSCALVSFPWFFFVLSW